MHNPNFSSGPCSKRPHWSLDFLKNAAVGRSHRSSLGKQKLVKAIAQSREILGIPQDYLIGIMPASDTGAFEAAMWTLLGPRPVTVLVWESFSCRLGNGYYQTFETEPHRPESRLRGRYRISSQSTGPMTASLLQMEQRAA